MAYGGPVNPTAVSLNSVLTHPQQQSKVLATKISFSLCANLRLRASVVRCQSVRVVASYQGFYSHAAPPVMSRIQKAFRSK
eukprot:scaffold245387_cov18-Tisochrysis_lutea.AAC.1